MIDPEPGATVGRVPPRLAAGWFRMSRGRFARGVAVLAGGTAAAQIIVVAVSPVLTRLFQPSDFGLLAVYASVAGIIGSVSALRFEAAIPLPRSDRSAANVLALSMLTTFSVSVAVAVLIGVALLSGVQVDGGGLRQVLWLIPVGLAMTGLYRSLSHWAVRRRLYDRIARTRLTQALTGAATQVLLGFGGAGPIGLVAGSIIGQSGGIGTLASTAWQRDASLLRAIRWGRVRAMARRFRRFPMYSAAATLLNSSGMYIAPFLLLGTYGPQVVGWFALAERITRIPITLVGTSVAQVYTGEVAGFIGDPTRLKRVFLRATWTLALVALVPGIVLAAISPWLFETVFGRVWIEAGIYVRLLAVWLYLKFISFPLAQNLELLERQDLLAMWSGLRLASVIASLTIPAALGASPATAILSFAVTGSLMYMVLIVLSYHSVNVLTQRAGGPGDSHLQ